MKTIFITGASAGLGKAAAILFAANGWRVIATMRNPQNETELQLTDNIELLQLDVTNPQQIKDVAGQVTEKGDIDVVFNNAGFGLGGPLESYSDNQITAQINTNMLGVIRVTQAFVPYFRNKRQGLFITTTSIGGLITFPFFSVYHATKWALEGFYESISFELDKFGIGVKTISPGGIRSNFSQSLDVVTNTAYDALYEQMYDVFRTPETLSKYSSAAQIARVVYEAATDGKKQLRYQAGADAQEYYASRLEQGAENFIKDLDQRFFGRKD